MHILTASLGEKKRNERINLWHRSEKNNIIYDFTLNGYKIDQQRRKNKKSIYRNRIENTDFKMIIKKIVNKEKKNKKLFGKIFTHCYYIKSLSCQIPIGLLILILAEISRRCDLVNASRMMLLLTLCCEPSERPNAVDADSWEGICGLRWSRLRIS